MLMLAGPSALAEFCVTHSHLSLSSLLWLSYKWLSHVHVYIHLNIGAEICWSMPNADS